MDADLNEDGSKLRKRGIVATAIYMALVIAISVCRRSEFSGMQLNAIGDFIAGILSPLALFWLVLGFIQQGMELQQNTTALRQQAGELKNSVEQQKQLVVAAQEQLKIEKDLLQERVKPYFRFQSASGSWQNDGTIEYQFQVINSGAPATDLRFDIKADLARKSDTHIRYLPREQDLVLRLNFERDKLKSGDQIIVTCLDADGNKFERKYVFRVNDNGNSVDIMMNNQLEVDA